MMGKCKPPIEMERLRTALREAVVNFIMSFTDPAEVWVVLDRQYGNREITFARTITQLLALKIPKGPGYKKVEALLLSMQMVRACLKAVNIESGRTAARSLGQNEGKLDGGRTV